MNNVVLWPPSRREIGKHWLKLQLDPLGIQADEDWPCLEDEIDCVGVSIGGDLFQEGPRGSGQVVGRNL